MDSDCPPLGSTFAQSSGTSFSRGLQGRQVESAVECYARISVSCQFHQAVLRILTETRKSWTFTCTKTFSEIKKATYPSEHVFDLFLNRGWIFIAGDHTVESGYCLFDFLSERVEDAVFVCHIAELIIKINNGVIHDRVELV
jgi:hypothetical protein